MKNSDKVFIAGANGMVGKAIMKILQKNNYENILSPSRGELDLMNSSKVDSFFDENRPDYIFFAAARVGGIQANNKYKVEFLIENLTIQNHIIMNAYKYKVRKLLFLGSSCIYPKNAIQPIKESSLLSNELEKTNEAYAIAKITGIKLCEYLREQYGNDFITVMPTNLYGLNDNFDLFDSHVIPALIHKIYLAKKNNDQNLKLIGSGHALREFLHVDDLANALVYLMKNYSEVEPINVGSGNEIKIADLSEIISNCIEYKGNIIFDTPEMDGTQRKFLDSSKITELGWKPEISLEKGIKEVCTWFMENYARIRK